MVKKPETIYDKMEFPEYVYREYPKMVKLKSGESKIVGNHSEELQAIDEIVPVSDLNKVVADKANLEKLLAETQAALARLQGEKVEVEPAPAPPAKPEVLPISATIKVPAPSPKP